MNDVKPQDLTLKAREVRLFVLYLRLTDDVQ